MIVTLFRQSSYIAVTHGVVFYAIVYAMLFTRRIIFRAIAIVLVHTLLLSSVSFALDTETLASPSRFWDDELIRVIKEGEATGNQVYSGKHFVNSTAIYWISQMIGDDLSDPPGKKLKKPVTPKARAKALSKFIQENIDPVELAMSKTHHDPILKGFEIDKLRYNEKHDWYELPIYRDGVEKFYYKFYIDKTGKDKDPKHPDDWEMMPVGDGMSVYVGMKTTEDTTPQPQQPASESKTEMGIILLGTSGVGKSSLAKILVERFGWEHISRGDILIEETDRKTALGLKVQPYMDSGRLVPDDIVNEIIADRVKKLGSKGFILDGYPRTKAQARSLDETLKKSGISIDKVIYLKASLEVVLSRLSGRYYCKKCGRVYHKINHPPKKEGICDECKIKLSQRPYDKKATIHDHYREATQKELPKILSYYRQKEVLETFSADVDVYTETSKEVLALLEKEIKIKPVIRAHDPDALERHIDLVCKRLAGKSATRAEILAVYDKVRRTGRFARISQGESDEVDNLEKALLQCVDFNRAIVENRPFFLSGVPDNVAKAYLEKLQKRYEVTRGKILTMSFSDLMQKVKEQFPINKLMREFKETGYAGFFVYGYYPFKEGQYTTEEAIKALSVLRNIRQHYEKLNIGIMVFASSEYDFAQFTSRQRSRSYFPLANISSFFHYDGEKIVEYIPREIDGTLRFAQDEQKVAQPPTEESAESKQEITKRTGFELEENPKKRAEIIAKNREYLKSKKWLKPLEKLPYDRIFALEDEKFPAFLEAVIERNKWMAGLDWIGDVRQNLKEEFGIVLPKPRPKKLNHDKIVRHNIKPLGHLLQSVYFYAHNKDKDANDAFKRYLRTLKKSGSGKKALQFTFSPGNRMHDHYFGLAKFILLQSMKDYMRARFVFGLSAKYFSWDNRGLTTPEEIARCIGACDVWSGEKRSIEALKAELKMANSFAKDFVAPIAERNTEFGNKFRAHFERTKEETLKASSLVSEQGTAVIFGAGILSVVPLAEMLREKLPDGSLKYKKIILIDLAKDYVKPALQKLIDSKVITNEEAKRVEISIRDATNLYSKITNHIDQIILKARNSQGEKYVPVDELSRFIRELTDLFNMFSYATPITQRELQDKSVNFVVCTLSLEEFTRSIIRYIMAWLEGYPQWLRDWDEVHETWEKYYDRIEYCLTIVTLDEIARILVPEGVLFFADFIGKEGIVDGKKIKSISEKSNILRKLISKGFDLKGQDCRMQEVNSASWRRPAIKDNLTERIGHSSIVGALTIKKMYKSESTKEKRKSHTAEESTEVEKKTVTPESEQVRAIELVRTVNDVQAKPETKLSFIALGTNSLCGKKEEGLLGHSAINPLVSSLRNFCEKEDIRFIDGNDDEVAEAVKKIKEDSKEARGIVLAEKKAIDVIENYLKEIELKNDKNILLAELNNKHLTPDSYIRLCEMLNLTIKLLQADSMDEKAIQADHSKLGFKVINEDGIRRITFEPDAEPMDYKDREKIYRVQRFA